MKRKLQNMTTKTQNVRQGSKKCRYFRMCLNFDEYQLKTCCRLVIQLQVNICKPHINNKSKKNTIDKQKLERKEHKHTVKESNQTTRE